MRLTLTSFVNIRQDVTLTCTNCEWQGPASDMKVDLDGPAFDAYYCSDCQESFATEEARRRHGPSEGRIA